MVTRDKDKHFVTAMTGVERKTLAVGDKSMVVKFVLAAGAELPRHSHPHEQVGYLIAGEMIMTIGDQDYPLTAGDSWAIPGGVEHSVTVQKYVEAIEVFVPIREDYIE
ncbi:cupin domain-containing protein [Sporomusa sp.]|uniref:cupin domain-containing protein n=1 Tax=Sporomusa sp. TaxID=2078658 RepID=UPI002C18198A|nr:cupin domain-containing protein [Sporomusa sp.]HWR44727.1 cupin domain-containing protein [Sporomusa sp.]